MNYLVTVYEGDSRIERVLFTYRDEALNFVDRRRKQGYRVFINSIIIK